MDRWLINGEAMAELSIEDRGVAYGDGVFETIALRQHQCRLLDAHLQRLRSSAEKLRIVCPEESVIRAEIDSLAAGVEHGVLKIILTRGPGKRGYSMTGSSHPTLAIGVEQTQPVVPVTIGVRVRYCQTPIGRNVALAGLKTLNRLEQVLARAEWDDPEIAEGLMLDEGGAVICGTMSNVFACRDGAIYTPDLLACGVSGVMRQLILEVAAALGIDVHQQALLPAELEKADDLFLSNALIGVWPIAELAGQAYERSETTREIMRALYTKGISECQQ